MRNTVKLREIAFFISFRYADKKLPIFSCKKSNCGSK